MIKISNLTKVYKSKSGQNTNAINNINLTLPSKGIIFLTGKSGSGKTTLLNLLGGMDKADSGEIIIQGKSDKEFKKSDYDNYRNNYIGFVFQDFCILEDYTVAENVGLAYGLQRREAKREEIESILTKVDLDGYYDRRPNELSGGQKQRVAIARALIKNPEIILADEPTGNLDFATGAGIFDLLARLSLERLVVIVSHDREAAYKYGERIITLSDGNIESDEINRKEIPIDCVTIDDNLIYLPKRKMTDEELKIVNSGLLKGKKIAKRKHILNDEDDIDKDIRLYRAIKTRFPIQTAIMLGSAGLKLKPLKAVGIIVLMVMAFSLLGTVAVALFFNQALAISKTIDKADINNVLLVAAIPDQDTGLLRYDDRLRLPYSTYEGIAAKYSELFVSPVYGIDVMYLKEVNFRGGKTYGYISGLLPIAEDKLYLLGYEIGYGIYPVEGNGDIAITDYLADLLISLEEFSSYEEIINSGYDDMRGYNYTICGIINTNYKEKYADGLNGIKSENKIKLEFESRNYFDLFFTSDINSAENIINSINNLYFHKEMPNNNYLSMYICSNTLLANVLSNDDIELSYIDSEAEIDEITLSGNQVIVSRHLFNTLINTMTSLNDLSFPYETSIYGQEISIVGVTNDAGLIYPYYLYTSDEIYESLFLYATKLESVFISVYNNSAHNIALFKYINSMKITHNTFYSSGIYEIQYFVFYLKYILLGVGAFFMVYSSIMLFNFISMSVNAKSKDIGILRAIGARSRDTAAIFLVEALFIAIMSAIISLVTILGGCAVLNLTFGNFIYRTIEPDMIIPFFNLNLKTIGVVFALSIFVAIIGALIPVLRLAHMRPVDAIKKNL